MNPPKIIDLPQTELVGIRIHTTLAKNETRALWGRFQKLLIALGISREIEKYYIQIFGAATTISNMSPNTEFEKWAAVESKHLPEISKEMETITLSGKYAIFIHKGLPSDFPKTAAYIYREWLPNSGFTVDHRPHFEIMPPNYSPVDPNTEEEVLVPLK
ncbi:GyrI-like domain-containing protein [Flagellimonas marina]|uniref:GyrI-like domain-containing protein n=1 Tax=Flagellimonas marina TaxID=1775168 RepID=A0ABV8PSF8_9FLAO